MIYFDIACIIAFFILSAPLGIAAYFHNKSINRYFDGLEEAMNREFPLNEDDRK